MVKRFKVEIIRRKNLSQELVEMLVKKICQKNLSKKFVKKICQIVTHNKEPQEHSKTPNQQVLCKMTTIYDTISVLRSTA